MKEQKSVRIYTTRWCGYCHRAKAILKKLQVDFEEIAVDSDPKKRAWLREVSGQHTVPQIFIDERSIGGCDDLEAMVRKGEFAEAVFS